MNEKKQELDLEELNKEFQQELEALQAPEEDAEYSAGPRDGRKKRRKSKKKKVGKKMRSFHVLVIFLVIILLLLAVAAAGFFWLRAQGEKQLKTDQTEEVITAPEEAVVEDEGKIIIYNGEQYCYNENVISILCMGVDKTMQDNEEENLIGENGQADTLFLVVFDTDTGKLSLLNISRDSMVDVNRYNVDGYYLGTEEMQICLAYSYGDGRETSCQNVAESVSRLLYGMPVNAYAAIDYSGISAMNDAVGGVTVEVLEDLTQRDSELRQGAVVTLQGEQAHTYVRYRDTSVLESNDARMARQRQYLLSFMNTVLQGTRQDISLPLTLYQNASSYMVTDVDVSEVTYLASRVVGTELSEGDMHSIPGEIVKGKKYAEFYPDEDALYELILNIFYTKQS